MDLKEFTTTRIESLMEDCGEIRAQSDEVNEFDNWSALKLILHSSVANLYTKVMSNQDGFSDIYYIDALAGSGITVSDEGHSFLGSPLLAAKVTNMPFTKMYLIEADQDRAEALESRMEYAFSRDDLDYTEPDEWEVYTEDANDRIPRVVDEINYSNHKDGYNYYCFIDNQAMDVNWSAIEKLTPKPWGDLLINLPTAQAIGRTAGTNQLEPLNNFYGRNFSSSNLPRTGMREHLKNLYIEQIQSRGREKTVSTNVDANVGSFEYDLLYATRETEGGSDYVKGVEYVKNMIENLHAGDVGNILEIITGDQSGLEQYYPEEEPEVDIEEDTSEGPQSTLDGFSD